MKPYVISNAKQTEFWNNEEGWVDLLSATKFTEQEKKNLRLPVEGFWVTIWEVNSIQFARFIAECEACGVFSDENRMEEVAESMDLYLNEVYDLISRAQNEFDDFKASL